MSEDTKNSGEPEAAREPTAAERAQEGAHGALRAHLNQRRDVLQRQIAALENAEAHLTALREELDANTAIYAQMGWETPEAIAARQDAERKAKDAEAQKLADAHPARTLRERDQQTAERATLASIR